MNNDNTVQQMQSFLSQKGYTPPPPSQGGPTDWHSLIKSPTPTAPQSGSNPLSTYEGNVSDNLKGTFSQGASNVTKDIGNTSNLAEQAGNSPLAKTAAVGATAGHVAGDIASTAGGIIGSFISPLIPDNVKNTIGDVTNHIADKVNQIPGMTPEIAKSLGDVFNTLTLEGGKAVEPSAVNAVKSGVGSVAEKVPGLIEDAKTAIKGTPEEQVAKVAAKTSKDALDVISPKLTKLETEKALAAGKGETKGILGKTSIAPDQRLIDTAEAVKGIVKKGATGAENINNIKTALSQEAESLKSQIKAVDHPYSFKELSSNLSKVETPISIKGTAFEKQIGAVKKAAIDISKKNGGNISSLLDTRKEFDALVSKEYPNLYDKENAPMRNAITGIRNSMNDFIEKNLPEGNQYRDSLKKQSLYYDAIDNIAGKSTGEVGTSKVGRVLKTIKDHPVSSLIGAGVADKALKATTGLGF